MKVLTYRMIDTLLDLLKRPFHYFRERLLSHIHLKQDLQSQFPRSPARVEHLVPLSQSALICIILLILPSTAKPGLLPSKSRETGDAPLHVEEPMDMANWQRELETCRELAALAERAGDHERAVSAL